MNAGENQRNDKLLATQPVGVARMYVQTRSFPSPSLLFETNINWVNWETLVIWRSPRVLIG
jgi:hypothetical protein